MRALISKQLIAIWLIASIIPSVLVACHQSIGSDQGAVYSKIPDQVNPNQSYLFYIHGKIIETEGINAVSPEFGAYDFEKILANFADAGFNVIGEVRDSPPDPDLYAAHIADGIQHLLDMGVNPEQITVVGFSKGGGLTILISDLVKDPDINYVLIGICGDWIDQNLELTGRVLSLYEESDRYGSSCQSLADRSPKIVDFKEIEFRTGKSHGTFYTADPLWMDPVIEWLENPK
jgi:hypothetical protein